MPPMRWRPSNTLATAVLCAGLIASAAGAGAAVPARAQQSIDQKIRDVEGLIAEASADEAAALREYLEAKGRKDAADARVQQAASRAEVATTALREAEAALESATLRLGATVQRVTDAQSATASSRQVFEAAAARRYRLATMGAADEAAALEADSPSAAPVAARYLHDIAGHEDQEILRYLQLKEDAEIERQILEVQTAELEEQRVTVAAEAARLQAIEAEAEAAQAVVAAETAAEKRTVDAIEAKKDQYEGQLKTLQAESDRIAKELASRQSAGLSIPKGNGQFQRPIGGGVSSPFGYRIHPIYRTKRLHTGIDFSGSMGTPIKAAGSGTVVSAGSMGGYGNAVVIDHGNGLATLYAHQSRLAVSAGDKVSTGAVVGYVGSTGASTGPHLHFEVRASGTPVDPAPYL